MATGTESTYWLRTSDITWSNSTALARAGVSCSRKPPATIGTTSSAAAAAVRRRGIETIFGRGIRNSATSDHDPGRDGARGTGPCAPWPLLQPLARGLAHIIRVHAGLAHHAAVRAMDRSA